MITNMLTLEQKVTSLELSKQMKELGFTQESEFVWIHRILNQTETNEIPIIVVWRDVVDSWFNDAEIICSAYLTDEVIELLGTTLIQLHSINGKEFIASCNYSKSVKQFADTAPNALAKLAIYLKKEGVI